VLDASAILAVINAERGSEMLTAALLSRAIASSVNLAEVQTKLVSRGWEPEQAWEDALSLVREVVPFDQRQARLAGDLAMQTRHLGLSLGGRACLALAISLQLPVDTGEKIWTKLKTDVSVHLIR
jgi:PIN domain nuclease of toxin-antitoxin system